MFLAGASWSLQRCVAGVRAPFYFGVRGAEYRMWNLKTGGMSMKERVVLFIVLVMLIFLFEMVKQEARQQNAISSQIKEKKGNAQ
jgi:hypothetical protein